MSIIATATAFILDTLIQSEEVKKFPKDFTDASVKWIRSWFLKDDPKTEEKINSDKSRDYKEAIVEGKVEELMTNPQFEQELKAILQEWQQQVATVQNTINRQNTLENSSIQSGRDVRIGDENFQAGGSINITNNYGGPAASAEPSMAQISRPTAPLEVIQKLREHIAYNRVKEAIDQLLLISTGHSDFQNLVLAQSSSFEQLRYQEMIGSISTSEANVESSKIISRILKLISELKA